MFIAHGDKFRKNARWIFGVIAILTSVGLVSFFTQSGKSSGRRVDATLPTLRGVPVVSVA